MYSDLRVGSVGLVAANLNKIGAPEHGKQVQFAHHTPRQRVGIVAYPDGRDFAQCFHCRNILAQLDQAAHSVGRLLRCGRLGADIPPSRTARRTVAKLRGVRRHLRRRRTHAAPNVSITRTHADTVRRFNDFIGSHSTNRRPEGQGGRAAPAVARLGEKGKGGFKLCPGVSHRRTLLMNLLFSAAVRRIPCRTEPPH